MNNSLAMRLVEPRKLNFKLSGLFPYFILWNRSILFVPLLVT